LARELIILPRFKRDYRNARKHAEFDAETLEYVFDALISGERLPSALREHRLGKRSENWSGFTECHLGADLLLIYRVRRRAVVMHRMGTHTQLFGKARRRERLPVVRRPRKSK
jgi:mRNA interferase YafQ